MSNNKIIIFKVAKNMGTTIDYILNNYNEEKSYKILFEEDFDDIKIKNSDILFIAHQTTIQKFKTKYKNIYDNSIKIIIYRNPYERIVSSYNYLGLRAPIKYYLSIINRNNTAIRDDKKHYNHHFIHFETQQTDAIDYNKGYHNKDYIWLLMDDVEDVFKKLSELNVKIPDDYIHKNKTKNKTIDNKLIYKEDIKILFDKKFKKDVEIYNKLLNLDFSSIDKNIIL